MVVKRTLEEIAQAAAQEGLSVMGVVSRALPEGMRAVVLLGPDEPGFWPMFTASPEYLDGAPDPTDRWSARVIGALAERLSARAYFPFGGPPYQPFLRWARDSGRSFASPVGLLVHDTAGMMVSFRGGLGFSYPIEAPATDPSPCLSCADQPCLTACPADAFASGAYDVDGCKADLDRAGNDCMTRGCALRRACPVSKDWGRIEAHSAFHMRAFR